MGIQYFAGTGSAGAIYIDCDERTNEFVALAAAHNNLTADQVLERLGAGESVEFRNRETLRDGAVAAAKQAEAKRAAWERQKSGVSRMICRSCGQTGTRGAYPFSTLPGSGQCDDCC